MESHQTPLPDILQQQTPTPLIVGLQCNDQQLNNDSYLSLQEARQHGYDYTTTIIPSTQTQNTQVTPQPIRTDLMQLSSQWWKTSIVGIVAMNEEEPNTTTNNDQSRMDIEETAITNHNKKPSHNHFAALEDNLYSSIQWSIHMNIPAIILPSLPNKKRDVQQYATMIYRVMMRCEWINGTSSSTSSLQLWIPVPFTKRGYQLWIYFTMYICRSTSTSLPIYCLLTNITQQPTQAQVQQRSLTSTSTSIASTIVLLHAFIGNGYPIAAIQYNTQYDFLMNKKCYPTLPKINQFILIMLLQRIGRTIRVLINTTNNINTNNIALAKYYVQYIQHIRTSKPEIISLLDTIYSQEKEIDYLDQLQSPLQPLKDHLMNLTYEVFEQDPIKYKQYQYATQTCIEDIIYYNTTTISSSSSNGFLRLQDDTIIVLVVGAGRGPLVSACCRAYRIVKMNKERIPKLKIYAIEKNPSAILYLNSMLYSSHNDQQHPWYDIDVTIIHEDLRYINKEKHVNGYIANIVISELLGSFGCNELSPECLNELLIHNTICQNNYTLNIPYLYNSYITPISSTKLYQQILQQQLYPSSTQHNNIVGYQQAYETPYVVRPHHTSQMYPEQLCWSFQHGHTFDNNNNTTASTATNNTTTTKDSSSLEREAVITFFDDDNNTTKNYHYYGASLGCGYNPINDMVATKCLQDSTVGNNNNDYTLPCWILNGFLGTFTTLLYESKRLNRSILLSTAPNHDFSKDMFSWFPLYFPLNEPILIPRNGIITLNICRKCNIIMKKVWYEWSVIVKVPKNKKSNPNNTNNNRQYEDIDVNDEDDEDDKYEVVYISPIHNPNGRSYHVAM